MLSFYLKSVTNVFEKEEPLKKKKSNARNDSDNVYSFNIPQDEANPPAEGLDSLQNDSKTQTQTGSRIPNKASTKYSVDNTKSKLKDSLKDREVNVGVKPDSGKSKKIMKTEKDKQEGGAAVVFESRVEDGYQFGK